MSFDRSLPTIEEDTSTSSKAQKDAKPSKRAKRKTRRDIASISQGPGGFHNPRGSHAELAAPIMADTESNTQPEAVAPVPEQEQPVPKEPEPFQASQPSGPPAEAHGLGSAHQEPPPPQNAKLDPAGFFTLVNNINSGASSSTSQQAHHPRVQYIFADDDPAELTAAIARSREPEASTDSRQPPRSHGIIVDVAPVTDPATGQATGNWKVTSASSISGGFAVMDAKITRMEDSASASGTPAKAKTGTESEEGGSTGGLMLKINGVEVAEEDAVDARGSLRISQSGDKASIAPTKDDYPSILEDFDKNMSLIRNMVAAGEKRVSKDEAEQAPDEAPQQKAGVHKNDDSDGDSG